MKRHFRVMRKDDGGFYFLDPDTGLILRLAGKPKFILEKYVQLFGKEEGLKKYKEFLDVVEAVAKDGNPVFVLYNY